ncbi:flagellar biosynthesis repressor FlbT [Aureimonas sp. ME7]|uniref:flagellar biosynthesis repressor FlbT n=1 Tax=Aureimonas sp. ME7 TaxID=2744252 RepID=UPI0015F779D8|nr:flagellar biosynthesis repressor FlbT [Aureimonas sp. ME7]
MSTLRITLRAGERIFVNGAVMRVDRKTHLEFMNDVTFLLESHVMQPEDANTPLRQLYFIVQLMLIDPAGAKDARAAFSRTYPALLAAFSSSEIRSGIQDVVDLVERERNFEALKRLRALIPSEDAVLNSETMRVPSIDAIARPAVAMGAR